jgi:hypothetical protein
MHAFVHYGLARLLYVGRLQQTLASLADCRCGAHVWPLAIGVRVGLYNYICYRMRLLCFGGARGPVCC